MSERKDRNVPTLDMQKIEGVIDEMYVALAVRRRLCLRETLFIDAAEFAVEIGGLDVHILESLDGSRIFGGPVEAGPGQELHTSIVDASGHAKAVKFYFVYPLRP